MSDTPGVVGSGDLGGSSALAAAAPPEAVRQTGSRIARVLIAPVKLLWGMAFCQGLLGSILVIGWTYRLMQRSALKYWWRRSAEKTGGFHGFIKSHEPLRPYAYWPNWFARQNLREQFRRPAGMSAARYAGRLLLAPVHSLWTNFWVGLRGILTTWTLTLPACLLWAFGWYDGWNNSFNKGYEQAPVGPLISITGIFLFIAVMFYVPIAQARQAVSGSWRGFFQFRIVWSIVRLRWLACTGLALLYAMLAIPLNILKTFPMFFLHAHPEMADLSDAGLLKALNGYFFWCGLLMFIGFVLVRLLAGRIYASGLVSLVQEGRLAVDGLSGFEQEALAGLGLLEAKPRPTRSRFVRFVAWTGTRAGRVISGVVLALVWFGFVAQIYIHEFFNYHGALGWLNQPLVQLPWFHYLPARLKHPSDEIFFALFVLLVFSLMRSVAKVVLRHNRATPPLAGRHGT